MHEPIIIAMYRCECDQGYTGRDCDEDIDDCSNNMCQNGARCQDAVDSYTCLCPQGFTGASLA